MLDFRSKMLHQRLVTVKRFFHLEMRSLRSVASNFRYVLTAVGAQQESGALYWHGWKQSSASGAAH